MNLILFVVTLSYVGIVLGTYLKFNDNGLRFAGRSYWILLFLPFILSFIHIFVLFRFVRENKRLPIKLLFLPITKLPILIGVFIELILEKQAQIVASRSKVIRKTRRASKKISSINRAKEEVDFDFGIIKDAASLFKSKWLSREAV
jgi:cytochrome c biogenesis factor